MHKKNAKSQGEIQCANQHPKVPIGTLALSKCRLVLSPVMVKLSSFMFLGMLLVYFGSIFHSKKWLCNEISQKFILVVKLGHLAIPHSFFKKKKSTSSSFKKKKRKLTKSKIFKIMHSFSKLGTFGHALSPFQKKNQINHLFSRRNLFF